MMTAHGLLLEALASKTGTIGVQARFRFSLPIH